MSFKIGVLKNFAILIRNACVRVSFYKVAVLQYGGPSLPIKKNKKNKNKK